MKSLKIAPAARRDLSAIWQYTANAWGHAQAETYLTALHQDMRRLREFPDIGTPHPSRIGQFRKVPSGHHLIFYLIYGDAVEVIRVLHERMDIRAQLN